MPVEFEMEINIQTSTRGGYRRFIENLRVRLGERFSHNLPVLALQPPEGQLPTRFFDLVIRTNDHSVRFRFRMDNLYLIGYQMENGQWLEFNNEDDVHLIREQGTDFLGFCGQYSGTLRKKGTKTTYKSLGAVSDKGVNETRVGFYNLGYGINQLATSEAWNIRAHYLIVVIMMFCEATRLIPVLDYIATNFNNSRGTSSDDYNAGNRNLEGQIHQWIMDLIHAWEDFCAALLRADAHPDEKFKIRENKVRLPPRFPEDAGEIRNLFEIIEILGILIALCTGRSRRPPRMALAFDEDESQCLSGLPLLQVFSVRIDNIDGEDPGQLYGTVTVDDGLNTQYLYNRTSSDQESISPGQNALLIGPSQSILAIGNFTIKLILTDHDTFSWDDEIVNTDISWYSSEIGNVYDQPKFQKLDGICGSVTVNYAVLRNAVAARITVTLEEGGEYTTNVYGKVCARYGNWKDDPNNTTCLLFNRSSHDYVDLRRWQYIPLLRSVVAVPLDSSLIVTASLYDYDTFSDDEIAIGTVEFPAQMSETSIKEIKGKDGNWVTVTVYWSCQI